MECKFDTKSRELIDKNPYWEYYKDKYILPSGNEGDYFFVHTKGSVMIVPLLENGEFLMTEQFRYLNKRSSIEFPGGGVKNEGEDLASAIEELEEETGAKAKKITYIGEFNPFNGVTDEICKVYLAEGLSFVEAMPEESEEINIVKLSCDEIVNKIKTGEIYDGMTITAFTLFYLYYNSVQGKC